MSPNAFSLMGVLARGATALTAMCRRANSAASVRVSAATPALAAA